MKNIQSLGVSGVLVVNKQALIIRRSVDDSEPGYWEFPKGKVEFGEDPKDAIVREFDEEVGLDIAIKSILAISSWSYRNKEGNNYHIGEVVYEVILLGKEKIENIKLSPDHDSWKMASFEEIKQIQPMVEERRAYLLKILNG